MAPLPKTFDGAKEFRSFVPFKDAFKKRDSYRVDSPHRHLVSYLNKFHPKSPWRLYETAGAWFFEGSSSIVAVVFAYEHGYKTAKNPD